MKIPLLANHQTLDRPELQAAGTVPASRPGPAGGPTAPAQRRGGDCEPRRRNRRGDWVPVGRTLHLLDLQNLCFRDPACVELREAAAVVAAYCDAVTVGVEDHVVVGVHLLTAVRAHLAVPGARLVVGRGYGGAEDALMRAAMHPTEVARRYDCIVIGSGSHRLAAFAGAVKDLGLVVTVVAPIAGLSAELERRADRVVLLARASSGGGGDTPTISEGSLRHRRWR